MSIVYTNPDGSISRVPTTPVNVPGRSTNPLIQAYKENLASGGIPAKVIQSVPYQNALHLFQSDPQYGPQFLEQLKLIPYSASEGSSTLLDKLNLTNNANDIERVAYDYCIEQIQNLVNSYYEFINTLPTTQVSQLRDAGVNAAITGQGLQGSSQSFTSADSSRLASLRSGNNIDGIGAILTSVGSISSIASGLASTYKSLSEVKIARENLDINKSRFNLDSVNVLGTLFKSLNEAGYDMTVGDFSTVEGFFDFLDNVNSDPKVAQIANDAFAEFGRSYVRSQPWKSAGVVSDSDFNSILDGVYKSNRSSVSETFDDFFAKVASYEADILVLDTMQQKTMKAFDLEVAEEISSTEGSSEVFAQSAIVDKQRSNAVGNYETLVNETKRAHLSSWIDDYNKTKDPAEKYLILRTIYDMGLMDMVDEQLLNKIGSPVLSQVVKEAPEYILEMFSIPKKLKGVFGSKTKN